MKKLLIIISLLFCSSSLWATIVDGRFITVRYDENSYELKLQIKTNTGVEGLGGATLIIKYDNTLLGFPGSPTEGSDYIFQNFSGGDYSIATVTHPVEDEIRINIVLNNNNMGTIVSSSYMDVVSLIFKITNHSGIPGGSWADSNPDFQIFDDDNSTLWISGTFENNKTTDLPVDDLNTEIEFSLSQNYPNPFNPNTNFEFSIPAFCSVQLKIFDVLGNEVATLLNEEKEAGDYKLTFDGSNLASGIYYYELTAGNFRNIKKLVLLK